MSIAGQLLRSSVGNGIRLLRRATIRGKSLTAFLFHEVSARPSPFQSLYGLAVTPELFAKQIAWIARTYEIVHPTDLALGAPLPARGALITFDDGFSGALNSGVEYLANQRIPSLMFLNMRTVLERCPMVSAVALYLGGNSEAFREFAQTNAVSKPYHLNLTPQLLTRFEAEHGPVSREAVLEYQGEIATLERLCCSAKSSYVVYGNHLFDHWNAAVLSIKELSEQFERNAIELRRFGEHPSLFSFPNGQPDACFRREHVECVTRLGAMRVFSASGGVNRSVSAITLGRLSLGPDDTSDSLLWYRVARATTRRALPLDA